MKKHTIVLCERFYEPHLWGNSFDSYKSKALDIILAWSQEKEIKIYDHVIRAGLVETGTGISRQEVLIDIYYQELK